MSEISAIAAQKLSRLKRPFLSLSPANQLDFIAVLRERRARPKALKTVNSRRAKNVESKDQTQSQSQEPQAQS